MAQRIAPAQKVTEKTVHNVFTIADITKAVDLDGDGIEPEDKEILDVLKSMDVDGDGAISLRELVHLGSKLNEQQKQSSMLKKILIAVLVLTFLAIMAVFLACLAAVYAGKDSVPEKDGTLKTVVTSGDIETVATKQAVETLKLTELHSASFSALKGIKDVGFTVENKVYAYTITGFEQDIGTDGNIAVRLFTTRQDTIYVSASQAILEKVAAGKTIDISKVRRR